MIGYVYVTSSYNLKQSYVSSSDLKFHIIRSVKYYARSLYIYELLKKILLGSFKRLSNEDLWYNHNKYLFKA